MKKFNGGNYRTFQSHINILPKNFIGEDIQSMLRPFNLLQNLIFCPKYSIRNNFIAPNNIKSNLISRCATLLFTVIYFYRAYFSYFDLVKIQYLSSVRVFISIFEYISYSIGFILNTVTASRQTNNSIDFVLTIQEVHCILNSEDSFKIYTRGNWTSATNLIIFYLIYLIGGSIVNEAGVYLVFCCVILLISFDINLVYAIRLIQLLKDEVDLWNDAVLSSRNTRDELVYKTLFETYVKILKCYEIYKNCFQLLILYHIVESFLHALIYIEIFIDISKVADNVTYYKQNIGKGIMILTWVIKNIVLETVLSARCESFYDAVRNAQDMCKIKTDNSGEKILYKNVQRVHKAKFNKMTACGLFNVDALLTLRLVGLLTQHIIVLLQFALL